MIIALFAFKDIDVHIMVKSIKITPNGMYEIDNYEIDADYKDIAYTILSLDIPDYWVFKNFKLAMMTKDMYTDCDERNNLATFLVNKLKTHIMDQIIYGTVYILNEDDENVIDMTQTDMTYIMSCIRS